MAGLVWDELEDRTFQTGLDRGVLYLPATGIGVPWNGLVSISESANRRSTPVYFDGKKINDITTFGEFSATMKALTYPDEFAEIEGMPSTLPGVSWGSQRPKMFGLCYRTRKGNGVDGVDAGYKIHIIVNVTAIPKDKDFETIGDSLEAIEFEWDIVAVPEELEGMYPTAHIELDTTKIDPWLLEDIEAILYGSTEADAALLPADELFTYLRNWARVSIVDNGDGTWTATEARPGFISFPDDPDLTWFQIENVNATYLIPDEVYTITDTNLGD